MKDKDKIVWHDSEGHYESFANFGLIRLWARQEHESIEYKAGVSGYGNHWTKRTFPTMEEAKAEAIKLAKKHINLIVKALNNG